MASAPPALGSQIGHFRLLEKIGAGGMGEVYLARDQHLQREVAIKLLPAGSLPDPAERDRFRREALALSKLNHPNIATIHDFDTDGDVDFLVMEFVPGASLREKLDSGPLPEPEAVRLATELAAGMAAAHQHGVIHRDLKPENLRIAPDGHLKILDFGVAKLIPTRSPLASAAETSSLYQGAAGTLPYMSPEQVRDGNVDQRSDLWAAGVLLYEMTTGHRPFASRGSPLAGSILQEYPMPPRHLRPGLSPQLEAVILKCLEKEPTRRYRSARELLAALETLASGPQSALATIASPRRRPAVWIVALAICTLAVVIFALYHFRGKSKEGTATVPLIRSLSCPWPIFPDKPTRTTWPTA